MDSHPVSSGFAVTPMILREALLSLTQLVSGTICTEDMENSKALRIAVRLVYWQPRQL